jgi:hypothetical protein
MDSQDRDRSKMRGRDESFAQRLGEALDEMDARNAADCPDGEILAAYAEHGLSEAESGKWESHFASCARCRKILLVLAASADTPLAEKEVARLGALSSSGNSPIEITEGSAVRVLPRLMEWRARWLAPALGVAAVLVVWFVMRPPWRATDRSGSPTLIAQAPKEEARQSAPPTGGDAFEPSAPQQKGQAQPAPSSERSSANAQPLNLPVEGLKKDRADAADTLDKRSLSASEATDSLQLQEKSSATPNGREIQPTAIPPTAPAPSKEQADAEASAAPQSKAEAAPAVPGPVRAEVSGNAIDNPATRDKQAGATQPAASALAVPAPSPQVTARARNRQGFAALKAAAPASVQATAPFGSTVWRFGKGGRIERSADGGETWIPQTSPILEDWLAGVAVSDTVCWAAGSNGSIARTTDGERWDRVVPPAMAAGADAKLPDWTGITARDAQSATITASDGRRFATVDGGKSWQVLP